MAWITVSGSNGIWEYDNATTSADTYIDANGTVLGGIRTYVSPFGNTQETYIKVRKAGEIQERGELSKNYYDAKV
jgi:hypothetical protein